MEWQIDGTSDHLAAKAWTNEEAAYEAMSARF
jgi:hypothetical protein